MERGIVNSRSIQILPLLIIALIALAMGQTNETDWFQIGSELFSHDKFEEAVRAYDNATKINPLDAEAWNDKGIALGMLGRYDEALQAFEEAITVNSSYAEAWYNIGAIFDLQGNYMSAIKAYNEATKINPNYQKAWQAKNRDINIIGMKNYLNFVQGGYS